jgi:hypothetical protein
MHVQVIVSRKDITNKIKLSPMNNSRGSNAEHSAKLGQFDRKAFKQAGENLFDVMFSYNRELTDTMAYSMIMKTGSAQQKKFLFAHSDNWNHNAIPGTEKEDLSTTASSLEQLLGKETVISGELVGSLFPLDAFNIQQEDLDPALRKKKKKRLPPRENG